MRLSPKSMNGGCAFEEASEVLSIRSVNVERIDDTHFSFSNDRGGKEQSGVIEVIRKNSRAGR